MKRDLRPVLACLFCVQILLGLLIHGLARRRPPATVAALGLLVVLCSGFALFVLLGPKAHDNPALALALFVGAVGLFRVLGRSVG